MKLTLALLVLVVGTETAFGQSGDSAIAAMVARIHDNIAIAQCRVELQGYAIQFYEDYALAIRTNQPNRADLMLQGAREIARRSVDLNPGSCMGQNKAILLAYVTSLGKKVKASKP